MYLSKSKTSSYLVIVWAAITLAAMVLGAAEARGADIRWKKTPYSHYAQNEDIKDVLTDFFAFQNIGVVFSKEVKGKVSGNFKAEIPHAFFKNICNAYNLIWYYDGAAAYIYSAHEMTSNVVNLRYLNMKQFRQNLYNLGMVDKKFALRIVDKDRIVYVSGPRRYVELISSLAQELDEKAMAQRGENDVVQVFKLKYAWADDKTILFRDREMTVPGVATILRGLISGNTAPGQVAARQPHQLRSNLTKLKGTGLARHRDKDDTQRVENESHADKTSSEKRGESKRYPAVWDVKQDLGVIEVDTRQNAVAVRDREEKMPYYKTIIDLLDVPVGLVEIKATIIDINRDNIEELGIEWEFASTVGDDANIITGGVHRTDQYSQENGLQVPIADGLNMATIIGEAANYFLAKVRALQEQGHAKILSRPSVLTLNNIEAQLEHSRTFYVRLEGQEEVDLYDINTGVVLKVTPHIIEENKRSFVKLAIQIEDGELLGERVDQIPVVKRSVVNTQAVVGHNESLLLGGYLREGNVNSVQTVPCLGDIPLIGRLFRKQFTQDEKVERLFLITPTIKPYGSNGHIAKHGDMLDSITKKSKLLDESKAKAGKLENEH